MAIYRYQTLNLTISINKNALIDFKDIVVSIAQRNRIKHFKYSNDELVIDAEDGTITFALAQEDTAWFKPHTSCSIQVNIQYNSGERTVSEEAYIDDVYDNLYDRVMTNE